MDLKALNQNLFGEVGSSEPLKVKKGDYLGHIFLEESRGLVADEAG